MDNLYLSVSAVVVCSSILAWLACKGRQPIILGYFLCGILLGPTGFGLVPSVGLLDDMSRIGVALLLFFAGLVLHPARLHEFLGITSVVTIAKSVVMWLLVFVFLRIWGFGVMDSAIASVALMFSSTILVVKLLPTTTLHQKRMGAICIAVLIAEDLLAVIFLMFVGSAPANGLQHFILWLPAKVVLLTALAVVGEQFILRRMMRATDTYGEVLVMLCLGWCVGLALLAGTFGIPPEVGAFVAGVTIARGKVALVLSEQLKPLRDFFLMFFFFVLGARFDILHVQTVWLPAVIAAVLIVTIRPLWLGWLFERMGEERAFAREMGIRLGQASEFALLIAVVASQNRHLSAPVAQLVQLTTVLTMLISSYLVVFNCPTPIGVRPGLQRD